MASRFERPPRLDSPYPPQTLRGMSNKIATLSMALCLSGFARAAGPDHAAGYTGPKEKLHVYLLIGQSNMSGRAKLTPEDQTPLPHCYLLNGDDQWEAARNPLNRYSTIGKGAGMQKLNPGAGFAPAMLEPGISIGLVVNARGGSKIDQWKRGSRFYNEALRRANEARKTGTLTGILWHQGESDSGMPDGYLDKLAKLVADLRKDLKTPDLPFVAGQVHDVPAINDQIAKLPQTVPHTGVASSEGLKTMDRWHFDRESMLILGRRYAEEMKKLLKAGR